MSRKLRCGRRSISDRLGSRCGGLMSEYVCQRAIRLLDERPLFGRRYTCLASARVRRVSCRWPWFAIFSALMASMLTRLGQARSRGGLLLSRLEDRKGRSRLLSRRGVIVAIRDQVDHLWCHCCSLEPEVVLASTPIPDQVKRERHNEVSTRVNALQK